MNQFLSCWTILGNILTILLSGSQPHHSSIEMVQCLNKFFIYHYHSTCVREWVCSFNFLFLFNLDDLYSWKVDLCEQVIIHLHLIWILLVECEQSLLVDHIDPQPPSILYVGIVD